MNKSIKVFILLLAVAICSMPLSLDARKSSRSSSGMRSGVVHKINATQFKRLIANYSETPYVLKCKRPVIVDFYATWCGPCQRLAPVMESVASYYAGTVDFYAVDAEKYRQVANTYGVNCYPTVFLFNPNTRRSYYFTGGLDWNELVNWIDRRL